MQTAADAIHVYGANMWGMHAINKATSDTPVNANLQELAKKITSTDDDQGDRADTNPPPLQKEKNKTRGNW